MGRKESNQTNKQTNMTPKNDYYQFFSLSNVSFGRVKETSHGDVSFMLPKHTLGLHLLK